MARSYEGMEQPGEADSSTQELTAFVEHGYSMLEESSRTREGGTGNVLSGN